jgi:hypothetical protein
MNFLVRLRAGPQHHLPADVRPAVALLGQERELPSEHSAGARRRSVGDTGFPVAVAPALGVLVLGGFLMFVTGTEPARGRTAPEESVVEATALGAPQSARVPEVESVIAAIESRDVSRLRELIGELNALDPNDEERLQLGARVVADCIEKPGEASLARARDFDAHESASSLRPFVNRVCFENRN